MFRTFRKSCLVFAALHSCNLQNIQLVSSRQLQHFMFISFHSNVWLSQILKLVRYITNLVFFLSFTSVIVKRVYLQTRNCIVCKIPNIVHSVSKYYYYSKFFVSLWLRIWVFVEHRAFVEKYFSHISLMKKGWKLSYFSTTW